MVVFQDWLIAEARTIQAQLDAELHSSLPTAGSPMRVIARVEVVNTQKK